MISGATCLLRLDGALGTILKSLDKYFAVSALLVYSACQKNVATVAFRIFVLMFPLSICKFCCLRLRAVNVKRVNAFITKNKP